MTTHDTRSQLLAEIAARPEDDTLRLAFADWLDEQPTTKTCRACKGDGRLDADHRPGTVECRMCWGTGTVADAADRDRAEFIRVQCELERLEADHSDHHGLDGQAIAGGHGAQR